MVKKYNGTWIFSTFWVILNLLILIVDQKRFSSRSTSHRLTRFYIYNVLLIYNWNEIKLRISMKALKVYFEPAFSIFPVCSFFQWSHSYPIRPFNSPGFYTSFTFHTRLPTLISCSCARLPKSTPVDRRQSIQITYKRCV